MGGEFVLQVSTQRWLETWDLPLGASSKLWFALQAHVNISGEQGEQGHGEESPSQSLSVVWQGAPCW